MLYIRYTDVEVTIRRFFKDIFGNAANLYKPFHLHYKLFTGYIVIR